MALSETATIPPTDWSTACDVSFLTAWQNGNVNNTDYGFKNYVYRINATNGNLGQIYATESFINGPQILWNVTQIRFHYPSEHTINGDSFALEMQIVLNDTFSRATWCTNHTGALSLFFNVGDTQDDFWDWTTSASANESFTLDLNALYTKTSAI